jgi:hypothetical protein
MRRSDSSGALPEPSGRWPPSLPASWGRRVGAPSGSRNVRYVDGAYTAVAKAERRALRQIMSRRPMTTIERPIAAPELELIGATAGAPIEVDVYQADTANDFRARPPPDFAYEECRQRLRAALSAA